VPEPIALKLLHVTLIVVATSIVVHGISVKPALARLWQRNPRKLGSE
jgi:NhaP-type Na+/H+ or K+/H+ antiporter